MELALSSEERREYKEGKGKHKGRALALAGVEGHIKQIKGARSDPGYVT